MPVYNAQRYLKEAIESILNQTFSNFEFIIIYDESTDHTKEILDFYSGKDARIKVITQKRGGIAEALQNGLQLCRGEWIFRFDSDDVSMPDRIALQLDEINKRQNLILVGGFCEQINEDGVILKINKYPLRHKQLVDKLENLKAFLPHPSMCYRRDVVNKVGGYRARFKYAEDTDLWLRLLEIGEIGCVDVVLIKLRKHSCNVSGTHIKDVGLYEICAIVCHFRRKFGFADPSASDDKTWEEFKSWIELKLESMGFFNERISYQAVSNLWFTNVHVSPIKRWMRLLINGKINFSLAKYLYRRFLGNVALKLAIQSKDLF
jgi:glycosyltransferase involved in cell wall biosynthesis